MVLLKVGMESVDNLMCSTFCWRIEASAAWTFDFGPEEQAHGYLL